MTGTRAAARARIEADIMRAARAQLADVGAAGLSLREVAREVGMVSSAIYRYVDSRDALLTRLIVEAYDALGEAVEAASASSAGESDLDRWARAALAVRHWAVEHPHDYLLLYGSPVPGYAAPSDTVGPGTRATLALAAIVGQAQLAGMLEPPDPMPVLDAELSAELDRLATHADLEIGAEHTAAFLVAWTQLHGLVGFELTGQTRGIVDSHVEFFEVAARTTGRAIGLR